MAKGKDLEFEKRLEQITEWMDNVQIRADLAVERILDKAISDARAEKQKQNSCTEEQYEKAR